MAARPVIVIHGGCGAIARQSMTDEWERDARDALRRSLRAGHDLLTAGGSAVDAVVAAVRVMEDDPHFNAGKGSVFTTSCSNELDAGLMDGWLGHAGGVSTVTRVKNPILLARRIMERTPHAALSGLGAEQFAEKQGIELVPKEYFFTQRRFEQLQKLLHSKDGLVPQLDHSVHLNDKPHDTVGAVALDGRGRLAAASSTGGMTGKLPGRMSDSCVPGAGYWADRSVAVSMTGHGDYLLRRAASHEIACLVKYGNRKAVDAAETVVRDAMADCNAGAVVLDSDGSFSAPFNSEGMFRGHVGADGSTDVRIWEY